MSTEVPMALKILADVLAQAIMRGEKLRHLGLLHEHHVKIECSTARGTYDGITIWLRMGREDGASLVHMVNWKQHVQARVDIVKFIQQEMFEQLHTETFTEAPEEIWE